MTPEQQSILAAEILGWKRIDKKFPWIPPEGYRSKSGTLRQPHKNCPAFHTDANAAWQLVEWMASPENGGHKWSSGISNQHGIPCIAFSFSRHIWHPEPNVQPVETLYFPGNAPTLPLAILDAFLRANGKEIE